MAKNEVVSNGRADGWADRRTDVHTVLKSSLVTTKKAHSYHGLLPKCKFLAAITDLESALFSVKFDHKGAIETKEYTEIDGIEEEMRFLSSETRWKKLLKLEAWRAE